MHSTSVPIGARRVVALATVAGLALAAVPSGGSAPDAAPRNTQQPAVVGSPVKGQILSLRRGAWAGTAPFVFTYQWLRCDAGGAACTPVRGATAPTHMLIAADVGARVSVRVTATNKAGSVSADAPATPSVTATAAAALPVNTREPSIGGTPVEGQVLLARRGSWRGVGVAFTYRWLRCDGNGMSCDAIDGAGAATYTLAAADVGLRVRVEVTATNAAGSAAAESNATPTVTKAGGATGVPASTVAPSVKGSPVLGQPLSASPGLWAGSLPITFTYQWVRCGARGRGCRDLVGETGVVHVVDETDLGRVLRIRVVGTNASGAAQAVSTATRRAVVAGGRPLYGAVRLPGGRYSVPVTSVALPQQLVIDRVVFVPRAVCSVEQRLVVRLHVRDTRGDSVRGAIARIRSVPTLTSTPAARRTDRAGWVDFSLTPAVSFPRTGEPVYFFVRVARPGDNPLLGVGTRRLVQLGGRCGSA